MSLLVTASLWILLAVAVGLLALVAAGIGTLYGRFARGQSDETAARGTNVVAIGLAVIGGTAVWIAVDAGTAAGSVLESGIVADAVAAVAGGLAAGVVGAGAIAGITRQHPDIPGVDDPSSVGRRYLRYVTTIFTAVFLLVTLAEPAIEAGAIATGGFLLAVLVLFWAAAPVLRAVTMTTRPPTEDERRRLAPLLEDVGLDPSRVRIVEGGDQYVTVELLGPPGGRVLFVGAEALSALVDATLRGVFAARREQAAHVESLLRTLVLLPAVVPILAAATGELEIPIGVGMGVATALVGLALTRRLRYYTDARAAERLEPGDLAEAFEDVADAAGMNLDDAPSRHVLASKPSLAARIERLPRRDEDGRIGPDS